MNVNAIREALELLKQRRCICCMLITSSILILLLEYNDRFLKPEGFYLCDGSSMNPGHCALVYKYSLTAAAEGFLPCYNEDSKFVIVGVQFSIYESAP